MHAAVFVSAGAIRAGRPGIKSASAAPIWRRAAQAVARRTLNAIYRHLGAPSAGGSAGRGGANKANLLRASLAHLHTVCNCTLPPTAHCPRLNLHLHLHLQPHHCTQAN